MGAGFFLIGVDQDYRCADFRNRVGVHSLRSDGSNEHIYAGAMGMKSREVMEILSKCYSNEACIDAKHAWHIAKKCVNGFKTQVELEGVDRYKHDVEATDEYTFEGMEASFADESGLDGKLSWKRFDHQQVLQALGEKDN